MNADIPLRAWRQFDVLADALHFGRAAQRLHMTQPPLTQAIAQLEAQLGTRLFDRSTRSVRLTAAGAALRPRVQALLAESRALPAAARAAAEGEVGTLRIGFVSTAGFALLPQWVQAFRSARPGVRLDLQEATGDLQPPLLARGELDVGCLLHAAGETWPGLQLRPVAREPLRIALPADHPLAARAAVPLAALGSQPWVLFPRRILPALHDALLARCHPAGAAPRIAQEAIQMQTIVNLVAAGLGLAWVPDSVARFQQRPGVVYRRVAVPRGSAPLPEAHTSLAWRPGDELAQPPLQAFLAVATAASAGR